MVTDLGNVIGWGDNSQGQIKWGGDPSYPFFIDITLDFWIDTDETIIDVFAGLSFSIAVTSLGRIFAWGEAYGNPYPIEITSLFYD
jgi:alpha-tubulin suppressor-like RCC1 family protein